MYWSSDGDSALMSVATSGAAPPILLAQASAPPLIAEDTKYLFWTDGTAVHRIAKETGESAVVYQAPHAIRALAARGSAVFLWTATPPDESVFSLYGSTDDLETSPAQLLDGRRDVSVPPLFLDDSHLYWLEGRILMRSDVDGDDEEWVALDDEDVGVTDIAASSTTLFWTNASGHRIYAAPK